MPEAVTIFEVGPRDGLQNERRTVSAADKIRLVDGLSRCGFRKIEVTSFVSAKWVPQMADASEVMAGISRRKGISYCALTPNLLGLERALAANADEVAIFSSASEGFSKRNINCTVSESFRRFEPVVERAASAGIPVRGYVSCAVDCPYDGPTLPSKVASVSRTLLDMGCYEVSLGDTTGSGTPVTVDRMLTAVLAKASSRQVACHFHDTNGKAIANIDVCLHRGLRAFDSSIGGLGGCPFAPGAKGNVDTEAVVELVHGRGYETGVDSERLGTVGQFARSLGSVGRAQEGRSD